MPLPQSARARVAEWVAEYDDGQSAEALAPACAAVVGCSISTARTYIQQARRPVPTPVVVPVREVGELERAIYIPDPHVPDEDPEAMAACWRFLDWWQPHRVFVLGDLWDAYSISRYRKDPRKMGLTEELSCVKEWLWELRRHAPGAEIVVCLGNHEARFQAYLIDSAPALLGLDGMTAEALMGLRDVGAVWVPYNRGYNYRGLLVEHGDLVSGKAGYTAHRLLERRMSSVICGHTHRLGHVHMRTHAGVLEAVEAGTLQQMQPEYARSKTNWQHGCAVSTWCEGDATPRLGLVPIIDGVAYWGGRRF